MLFPSRAGFRGEVGLHTTIRPLFQKLTSKFYIENTLKYHELKIVAIKSDNRYLKVDPSHVAQPIKHENRIAFQLEYLAYQLNEQPANIYFQVEIYSSKRDHTSFKPPKVAQQTLVFRVRLTVVPNDFKLQHISFEQKQKTISIFNPSKEPLIIQEVRALRQQIHLRLPQDEDSETRFIILHNDVSVREKNLFEILTKAK
jgi:hypothetical protein